MKSLLYSKRKILIITFLLLPFLGIISAHILKVNLKAPVRSDSIGYYSYLPAVFIHQDLSFAFMIDEEKEYTKGENTYERTFNVEEAEATGFHMLQNGNFLNKYPIGTAILLTPFFIIGHILSIIFNTPLDGWSYFYQYSCFYGAFLYFLSGLYFLKIILSKFFNLRVQILTLFFITFATPLFNYATYEALFSHIFSFFLVNLMIYLTVKWNKKINYKNTVILSFVLGLIILVRPANLPFVLFPFIYKFALLNKSREKIANILNSKRSFFLIIFITLITFIPQLIYYKIASDRFIIFPYLSEGFSLSNVSAHKILFSSQKGLFFWSPILLFALIGFFIKTKNQLKLILFPGFIVLILQLLILSTWSSWQLGWSFGQRAFVDSMGIFAIGLGYFIN